MVREPIAYLVAEYPAISHTFVFREVQALRREGLEVKTASVRRTEHLDKMTPAEQSEAAATSLIKDAPLGRIARAHAGMLATRPWVYVRILGKALALALKTPLRLSKAIAYFAEAVVLVDWMKREGVRHVHVHFANPAATVALVAAAGRTMSYSLSVHGPDVFYDAPGNLLAEKVAAAAFVRCISFFCRSQLMRLACFEQWAKFHVIRCGVDVQEYGLRQAPANAIPEILCVGRLVPAKGQHVLLRACHALVARGVPFHLTLVGDGPDRGSLEAYCRQLGIADAVTFSGAVGQDAVHAYYDRADLFVLPSFAEGLPVVLMEAMAKGIPCISTRIAGIPELIEHRENGLLLAASNFDGLSDCLAQLLSDGQLRSAFAHSARQRIEADYDLVRNCRRMAELFIRYANGGRTRAHQD